MVRDFQRVIGVEARQQVQQIAGRLPDAVIACVGGGSNAMGIFHEFLPDAQVRLIGCEAGGDGIASGRHAATLVAGSAGVLHGMRTYVLQDAEGQTQATHSISAGLDYPGVGPEHSYLRDSGRVTYETASDDEALEALGILARHEGIIAALESAHAIAATIRLAPTLPRRTVIVVNLSGRGDKDMGTVAARLQSDDAKAIGGRA
jgi:tryptophan synthase beta chain